MTALARWLVPGLLALLMVQAAGLEVFHEDAAEGFSNGVDRLVYCSSFFHWVDGSDPAHAQPCACREWAAIRGYNETGVAEQSCCMNPPAVADIREAASTGCASDRRSAGSARRNDWDFSVASVSDQSCCTATTHGKSGCDSSDCSLKLCWGDDKKPGTSETCSQKCVPFCKRWGFLRCSEWGERCWQDCTVWGHDRDTYCCTSQWDDLCERQASDTCAVCDGTASCGNGRCEGAETLVDCPEDCGPIKRGEATVVGGKFMRYLGSPINWWQAKAFCEAKNYTLAPIRSTDDWAKIKSLAVAKGTWIGVHSKGSTWFNVHRDAASIINGAVDPQEKLALLARSDKNLPYSLEPDLSEYGNSNFDFICANLGEDNDCEGVFVNGVCEDDTDKDGVADGQDNCPSVANPEQFNRGGLSAKGDACDGDRVVCGQCTATTRWYWGRCRGLFGNYYDCKKYYLSCDVEIELPALLSTEQVLLSVQVEGVANKLGAISAIKVGSDKVTMDDNLFGSIFSPEGLQDYCGVFEDVTKGKIIDQSLLTSCGDRRDGCRKLTVTVKANGLYELQPDRCISLDQDNWHDWNKAYTLGVRACASIPDVIPPEIVCPSDVSVLKYTLPFTWAEPRTFDNSGGAVSVTCSPASGSSGFPIGTTAVTCTGTDPTGNQASCSFDVTVCQKYSEIIDGACRCKFGEVGGVCNPGIHVRVVRSEEIEEHGGRRSKEL
mmetsp:Transcript_16630/g.40617  ORF Transcript_16630/g.40617 Transcript_16630/m.40617 type:complete len:719 (-) Transcript_16630:94-2250(-)|eukprot:CAMPEP_0206231360 /NCGR_PEP_ID=MMETSP0047_2-20121206/10791_2 /ASSEMBLY_ACC=CAM_ASM_000192 /TAXON_ID=195065 /ORGANISM="Chroomonas mesostigmatica_cf, Strain CCMP1168" /LENGTH=718 /DNA_ID=CAMNT_0053654925 /DNA_START=117 /DNA_END=2273 /DNA_ORIENTATION=-